jgi:hypothetical protein
VRSIFAARQRYMLGLMTKREFNYLVAEKVFKKWVFAAKNTVPHWRWLAEVSAYLELKFFGVE